MASQAAGTRPLLPPTTQGAVGSHATDFRLRPLAKPDRAVAFSTLSFFQIEMGQHGPMGPADKSSEQAGNGGEINANTDTYFHV
jgi:hypothetical protein